MLKEGSILCSPKGAGFQKLMMRIWCHSVLHPSLHQSRWLIQQKKQTKEGTVVSWGLSYFLCHFLSSWLELPSSVRKLSQTSVPLSVSPDPSSPPSADCHTSRWKEYDALNKYLKARVLALGGLMSDELRWSWCSNTRNKVHTKSNTLESSETISPTQAWFLEKLSSLKWAPGAKKFGVCCPKALLYMFMLLIGCIVGEDNKWILLFSCYV